MVANGCYSIDIRTVVWFQINSSAEEHIVKQIHPEILQLSIPELIREGLSRPIGLSSGDETADRLSSLFPEVETKIKHASEKCYRQQERCFGTEGTPERCSVTLEQCRE